MSKIQLVTQANLPTEYGIFKMVGFEFPDTKKEHVALVMGDISNQDEPVLARIHSECLTGDALQDQGMDTIEANLALGFKADERNFNVCADMFELLGVKQVRLMTNNPQKVETMKKAGINIVERVPLNVGENRYNTKYLDTKAKKMGHYIVHNNEEHLMTCPHCQEEVI